MTDPRVASLERVIFDAEHAVWLERHGQEVTPVNLEGAWQAATRHDDERLTRARAAAVAALGWFENGTDASSPTGAGGVGEGRRS